MSDRNAP